MKNDRVYLFEARLFVQGGNKIAKFVIRKYPAMFTGKNYLPCEVTADDEKLHGCHGVRLSGRIPADSLNKVHRVGMLDSPSYVTRITYYTRTDLEPEYVKDRLRSEIKDVLIRMQADCATGLETLAKL